MKHPYPGGPMKSIPPLSLTPTVKSAVTPGIHGHIVLLEGNVISLIDTTSLQKTKLPLPPLTNPQSLTFSRDGTRLFVSDDSTLVIYNMTTKQSITLSHMEPNPHVNKTEDVSPNNQYVVLTQSCCPGDVGRQIMTIDGKVLYNQSGGKIAWSPDSMYLAISKGDVTIDLPFGPQPTSNSVYLETVTPTIITPTLLLQATLQTSYLPITWLNAKTLLVEKSVFRKPFPTTIDYKNQKDTAYWTDIYDNPVISYETVTIQTRETKPYTYEAPPYDPASYAPDKSWKVYVDSKTSFFGPVYLEKVGSKEKKKISENGYAVWQP